MYTISAEEESRSNSTVEYSVIVAVGDNEHTYDVILPVDYYNTIAKKACSEKEFVEKAFRFLVERESPEEIKLKFELCNAFKLKIMIRYPKVPKNYMSCKYCVTGVQLAKSNVNMCEK